MIDEAGPLEPEVAWVLAAYGQRWRPKDIRPLGWAGGLSGSQFWRIEIPDDPLCLRRWPAENPSKDQLALIHAVLGHAARQGFRAIPTVRATLDGGNYVDHAGHLWELTTWVRGQADLCRHPNHVKLAAAMTTLAEFHRAVSSFVPPCPMRGVSPGIVQRLAQLRNWLLGDAAKLGAAIDARRWPELAARGQRVLQLFRRHAAGIVARLERAARLEVPIQICIRDVWHEHVLFEGDRVTGIIDFGSLGWDNVAIDVARLLGSLTSDYGEYWGVGLAVYGRSRTLSPSELLLVQAFDRGSTLLSGLNWLDWIFRQHREFEAQQVILVRMDHILTRLEQL